MNLNLASGGTVSVSEVAFGREYNEPLVHQVVTAYMAGGRQGTKAQKTRSEVNGGGRKPFRQKGTGRARAGTIRSPIWRGGGTTFAAKPRDFSKKVNKKMYRGAMQAILSELVRQERLIVVDSLEVTEPGTKALISQLNDLGFETGLIVTNELDENVYLSSRNVPGVYTLDVSGIDPVSLVAADKVIMTVDAVEKIQEWLG